MKLPQLDTQVKVRAVDRPAVAFISKAKELPVCQSAVVAPEPGGYIGVVFAGMPLIPSVFSIPQKLIIGSLLAPVVRVEVTQEPAEALACPL